MSREIERAVQVAAGGNRFAAVQLIAKRADEIHKGSPPRAIVAGMKPVSIAIAEAARGALKAKRLS